jgi:hypothetical protein
MRRLRHGSTHRFLARLRFDRVVVRVVVVVVAQYVRMRNNERAEMTIFEKEKKKKKCWIGQVRSDQARPTGPEICEPLGYSGQVYRIWTKTQRCIESTITHQTSFGITQNCDHT